MYLSKLTFSLVIYIILAAFFIQQLREWLVAFLGEKFLKYSFGIFFFLVMTIFLGVLFKRQIKLSRLFIILVIFIAAYFFAERQPYFSERTHIFIYGLLGYSLARDLSTKIKNNFARILFSLLLVSCVSGLDEILQYFLPYRVGEFRDFTTNVISGAFGITIFLYAQFEFR